MNAAEKLLATAAVTIGKSQSDVNIQCRNTENANTIFEWLTELAERLAKKNAFKIGDSVEVISEKLKGKTGKVKACCGPGLYYVEGDYVAWWFDVEELKHA
jgi:hypothetical protein